MFTTSDNRLFRLARQLVGTHKTAEDFLTNPDFWRLLRGFLLIHETEVVMLVFAKVAIAGDQLLA
jgi:hypothetical protein